MRTRTTLLLTLLLALTAAAAPPATVPATASHTFRYTPDAGATPAAVVVAGDFNGWSTTATPLTKGPDGAYTVTLDLPVGRHQYKFVADGKWSNDPTADVALDVPDGQGGKNSGVEVAAAATPTAAPAGTTAHTFKYAPPAGQAVTTIVVAGDFNDWSTTANPMAKGADGTYAVTLNLPNGTHAYKFVRDGNWMQDPTADPALDADDGNGGKNSGVNVGPPAK